MRRLAKNLILATALVSAIFIVDLSTAEAANFNQTFVQGQSAVVIRPDFDRRYLDFWSKFRDSVMPDEPQNNNPPKKGDDEEVPAVKSPRPEKPPKVVVPESAKIRACW